MRVVAFGTIVVSLSPIAALAEVMDKQPSLVEIWRVSITVGIGAVALQYLSRWIIPGAFIGAGIYTLSCTLEWMDPTMRGAIVREAGETYFWMSLTGLSLMWALVLYASILAFRKKSTNDEAAT